MDTQQKKVNRVIFLGFIISILVSYLFFLSDTARPVGKLQTAVCMYLPYLLAMPALGIGIFTKSVLRGKLPSNEWDIENAKAILAGKDTFLRKILARLYLLVYSPIFFLAGWAGGSALFYLLAKIFTK